MSADAAKPILTRRRFLRLLAAGAGVTVAGAGYARGIEPGWLDVDRVRVPLRGSELRPLRIVQLSDLHASGVVPLDMIAHAVERVPALAPDLVVLTGDYVTTDSEFPGQAAYSAVLRPLADRFPCYACLGNHDGPWRGNVSPWIRDMLAQAGIQLLHNSTVLLNIGGREIYLTGLGDLWTAECRPERCLFPLGESDADRPAHVLLCHNPDAKTLAQLYDWDLMLCGHTHGGQVRIPLLGAPVVPVEDHAFIEGLHPFRDRHIYITRGVGNLLGIRLNCRPWISVLEV